MIKVRMPSFLERNKFHTRPVSVSGSQSSRILSGRFTLFTVDALRIILSASSGLPCDRSHLDDSGIILEYLKKTETVLNSTNIIIISVYI